MQCSSCSIGCFPIAEETPHHLDRLPLHVRSCTLVLDVELLGADTAIDLLVDECECSVRTTGQGAAELSNSDSDSRTDASRSPAEDQIRIDLTLAHSLYGTLETLEFVLGLGYMLGCLFCCSSGRILLPTTESLSRENIAHRGALVCQSGYLLRGHTLLHRLLHSKCMLGHDLSGDFALRADAQLPALFRGSTRSCSWLPQSPEFAEDVLDCEGGDRGASRLSAPNVPETLRTRRRFLEPPSHFLRRRQRKRWDLNIPDTRHTDRYTALGGKSDTGILERAALLGNLRECETACAGTTRVICGT